VSAIQRTVALLSVAALASCSNSSPAAAPPRDAVPPGTAQVKVGDDAAGTTNAVDCTTVASSITIKTGDDAAGTTSTVTSADGLTVAAVDIRDVAGFTGSQRTGLQGDAVVHMTGPSYVITGTARGFNTGNPSATAMQPFSITVSC
jgi:lipoprotein LpqH